MAILTIFKYSLQGIGHIPSACCYHHPSPELISSWKTETRRLLHSDSPVSPPPPRHPHPHSLCLYDFYCSKYFTDVESRSVVLLWLSVISLSTASSVFVHAVAWARMSFPRLNTIRWHVHTTSCLTTRPSMHARTTPTS